jgi:hypothetical protein
MPENGDESIRPLHALLGAAFVMGNPGQHYYFYTQIRQIPNEYH